MAKNYIPKTFNGIASAVARDTYKKVGNRIAKDMVKQFRSVIAAFYNDYHPQVYRRIYRSYYFANSEGVKLPSKFIKMDSSGKGYTISIKVDPSNITVPYSSIVSGRGTHKHEGHKYSITEMVFYNTWVLGQHGGKLPYNILPEENRVPPEIMSSRWRCLKTGWTWIPPVMDESPMVLMDKWFKTYATEDNLNQITRNIVTASINKYINRAQEKYGGLKG